MPVLGQARGYYQIPRARSLKSVAHDIGLSPASLSELLRRAEARIVAEYLSRSQPDTERKGRPAGRGQARLTTAETDGDSSGSR